MLRDLPDVSYNLLGEDGEVTSYSMEVAGLHLDEREKVKQIVGNSLSQVSRIIAKKARFNSELSDVDGGYSVYDIPPFVEEGKAVIASLAGELTARFGETASDALVAGLHTNDRFAGFGRFESRVEFDEHGSLVNPLDRGRPQFTLTLKDPKTGRIIQTIRSTKESLLRSNLGDSFVAEWNDE